MKTGFDLDGVIFRDFLGLTRNHIVGAFVNYYLFFTRFGKFCYGFRRPNEKVKSWMENRQTRGEKIVIISGTNRDHFSVVKKQLDSRAPFYDELWLKERAERIAEFKAKTLSETGCRFYLEDNAKVAEKIAAILGEKARVRKWRKFYLIKLG